MQVAGRHHDKLTVRSGALACHEIEVAVWFSQSLYMIIDAWAEHTPMAAAYQRHLSTPPLMTAAPPWPKRGPPQAFGLGARRGRQE